MARDRLANALRRVHTDALHNTTIEVYTPTETPDPGQGYSVSYPDVPDATIDAHASSIEDSTDRDEGGTASEADVIIRVKNNTGISWIEYGAESEASIQVVDVDTGVRYEIVAVGSEHNGLLKLEAVEV